MVYETMIERLSVTHHIEYFKTLDLVGGQDSYEGFPMRKVIFYTEAKCASYHMIAYIKKVGSSQDGITDIEQVIGCGFFHFLWDKFSMCLVDLSDFHRNPKAHLERQKHNAYAHT
jgi:hypothetical protein